MIFSALAFSSSAATDCTCAVAAVAATVPRLLRNVRRECAPKFSGSEFFMRLNGDCQPFVILRRVHVKRQTGIIHDTLDARQRRQGSKNLSTWPRRTFSIPSKLDAAKLPDAAAARQTSAGKCRPDFAREIFSNAATFPSANAAGRRARWPSCEISFCQPVQFAAQTMELNMPALRLRIFNAVLLRKIQPIQFRRQRRVVWPHARLRFVPRPVRAIAQKCRR